MAPEPAVFQRLISLNGYSGTHREEAAMQVVCERDARIGSHRGAERMGR